MGGLEHGDGQRRMRVFVVVVWDTIGEGVPPDLMNLC